MTSINLTGRIDLNAILLRERLAQLGEQISTGRKGNTYAAIGTDAPKAIDLRAEIGRREAYKTSIDQALGKIRITQTVMDRLATIAERHQADVAKLMGVTRPEEIQIQAQQAKADMIEVAGLLNEKFSGEYLFGGSDTHNPPIPDPLNIADTGMGAKIRAEIAKLDGGNTAGILTATKAIAESNAADTSPFSVFLSTGDGSAEGRRNLLGNNDERIAYGVFANRNAAVISSGDTTGSWARDLLRGLASIAGLTPEKAAMGEGYASLIAGIQQGLKSSVNALALERGALGVTEARLESLNTLHESVTTSLSGQLSNLEEVDMAKTITTLQATQTQLEASYRAISIAQQLSLTRFLA